MIGGQVLHKFQTCCTAGEVEEIYEQISFFENITPEEEKKATIIRNMKYEVQHGFYPAFFSIR